MLHRTLLSSLAGGRVALHYLGPRDEPWLRALLDECARYVGRKRGELKERLRQPLSVPSPSRKLAAAVAVLERIWPDVGKTDPPSRDIRFRVFSAAARERGDRTSVLEGVARELGVEPSAIDAALFADLSSERSLGPMPRDLSPAQLALLANQQLVSSLLKRATKVRLEARGNTRALIRHARLGGLICNVSRAPHQDAGVILDISGPFALFRRTEVYGKALASLLPRAARCDHFELRAECALSRGAATATFVAQRSDPIFPARELPAFDSAVEERFARDFGRLAVDWEIVREPRPIETGDSLIFPDFELVHRYDRTRRWLLEIVGFWTPRYVSEKLAKLRRLGLERVIVCIDADRGCSERDLAPECGVLIYRRRVDAKAVLALIQP